MQGWAEGCLGAVPTWKPSWALSYRSQPREREGGRAGGQEAAVHPGNSHTGPSQTPSCPGSGDLPASLGSFLLEFVIKVNRV